MFVLWRRDPFWRDSCQNYELLFRKAGSIRCLGGGHKRGGVLKSPSVIKIWRAGIMFYPYAVCTPPPSLRKRSFSFWLMDESCALCSHHLLPWLPSAPVREVQAQLGLWFAQGQEPAGEKDLIPQTTSALITLCVLAALRIPYCAPAPFSLELRTCRTRPMLLLAGAAGMSPCRCTASLSAGWALGQRSPWQPRSSMPSWCSGQACRKAWLWVHSHC